MYYAGVTGEAVISSNGLVLQPQHSLATLPELWGVLVPGGEGTAAVCADTDLLARLAPLLTRAQAVLSVCTGATVVRAAGGAAGRRVGSSIV